jgi:hypothetical protein
MRPICKLGSRHTRDSRSRRGMSLSSSAENWTVVYSKRRRMLACVRMSLSASRSSSRKLSRCCPKNKQHWILSSMKRDRTACELKSSVCASSSSNLNTISAGMNSRRSGAFECRTGRTNAMHHSRNFAHKSNPSPLVKRGYASFSRILKTSTAPKRQSWLNGVSSSNGVRPDLLHASAILL